jgi:hypothetical protein
MRRLPFLALQASLAAAALFPAAVDACTCYYNSIQYEYDNNDAVFRGVAMSNTIIDLEGQPVRLVTFVASECWKGSVPTAAAVYTSPTEAGCGYTFNVGTEYLVFATGQSIPFWTHLCTHNSPWSAGGDWIAGQLPTSGCTVAVEERTWSRVKRLFE